MQSSFRNYPWEPLMTSQRKNFIARAILSHLLSHEPFLAMKASLEAKKIAQYADIPEKAIREFLEPWDKNK